MLLSGSTLKNSTHHQPPMEKYCRPANGKRRQFLIRFTGSVNWLVGSVTNCCQLYMHVTSFPIIPQSLTCSNATQCIFNFSHLGKLIMRERICKTFYHTGGKVRLKSVCLLSASKFKRNKVVIYNWAQTLECWVKKESLLVAVNFVLKFIVHRWVAQSWCTFGKPVSWTNTSGHISARKKC